MQRLARRTSCLIVGLLATLLAVAPTGMVPAVAAATSGSGRPIVAVVVGPTHSLTSQYLIWGEQIAQRAEGLGAEVRRVFYPDATWPNVVNAAQGANVFIYLGHGNGYPSPYTSTLMTDRQDGLGLDPAAGDAESVVQYYGEKYVAADLHLAPHAIVILNHLCYASGNSEPGYPDPTVAVAEQRVDNFAAGFLAAGAAGVFALGDESASDILSDLFGPPQTLDQLFMSVGYTGRYDLRFDSTRTPGTTAHLDPKSPGAYYRSVAGYLDTLTSSVVTPAGVAAAPASPSTPTASPAPAQPTVGGSTPASLGGSSTQADPGQSAVPAAPLRLWADHPVIVIGGSSQLTARIDPSVDGQIVLFQRRPAGASAWTDVARMTVGAEGLASVAVAPRVNTEFRVQSERVPGQAFHESGTVRVLVRQTIALQPSGAGAPIGVTAGVPVTFVASVTPAPAASDGLVTFVVSRVTSAGWRTILTRSVGVDAGGTAALTVRMSTHGAWSIRAIARPTAVNANSLWTTTQRIDVR